MTSCPSCSAAMEEGQEACVVCGRLVEPTACERHPDTSAGAVCVVCASPVCKECDAGGGDHHLCPLHGDIHVVEGWAQVYTTASDLEADLIRSNLEAEGVDAQVLSQKDHFSLTVELGDLSVVRVLVPAFEYEQAMIVIRDHVTETGEVEFACPECGEAYEPGEGRCSECGGPLPRDPSVAE